MLPEVTVALFAPEGTRQKSSYVPDSVNVCGLLESLSTILKTLLCGPAAEPHCVFAPDAEGVNITPSVQFFPTASPDVQLFASVKSVAGFKVAPLTVSIAAPLPQLVIVTFCAAVPVVPASCEPNVSIRFAGTIWAIACTAEPVSGIVCGFPGALSDI